MLKRITIVVICCLLPSLSWAKKNLHPDEFIHKDWMNTTISQEENFFLYSNDEWIKNNPIPNDFAQWSIFRKLGKANLLRLRHLLEKLPSQEDAYAKKINQQLYALYQSGLDIRTIEKTKDTPLLGFIQQIKTIHNDQDLAQTIGLLHQIDVPVFFKFTSFFDYHHRHFKIANIQESGLLLPAKNYYFKSGKNAKSIQASYLLYLKRLFININLAPDDAYKKAKDVWAFERSLAQYFHEKSFFRNPRQIDNRSNTLNIIEHYPALHLDIYFETIGFADIIPINNATPDYLNALNEIINKTSDSTIKFYLLAHLLHEYAPYLDRDYSLAACLFSRAIQGNKRCSPRWLTVVSGINKYLGFALGDLYVQQYHKAGDIKKAEQIYQRIKTEMENAIPRATWLSEETRINALKKLSKMRARIGYPKSSLNYSKLKISSQSFVENMRIIRQFEIKRDWKKINKPVDPNDWSMPPQTVNASYNASNNQINIPLGILQSPFFDVRAPIGINYGGIGVVMGHELFHGFDDEGSQFDGDGYLMNWWSDADWFAYHHKLECIVQQFSQYPVQNSKLHLNGQLISGEALADLEGIKLSFAALKASKVNNEHILNFNPMQQFFINFAHVWAGKIKDREALRRALTDNHPPGIYRVNGTIANVPEFYASFNLKMKNKKQCHIL